MAEVRVKRTLRAGTERRVTRYPLTGYGRTRDGFQTVPRRDRTSGYHSARDAKAFFAIEFPRNQDALAAAREQAQQRRAEKARGSRSKAEAAGTPCDAPQPSREDAP